MLHAKEGQLFEIKVEKMQSGELSVYFANSYTANTQNGFTNLFLYDSDSELKVHIGGTITFLIKQVPDKKQR